MKIQVLEFRFKDKDNEVTEYQMLLLDKALLQQKLHELLK